MNNLKQKSHLEVVKERAPWTALDGAVFGREDIFENDLDIFFHKHWIVVGVTTEIPEPGDVSTVDIGKSSIILVRDDDEKVRAFRNVCRHRGARLKEPGLSTVGMLVCPYHQWTYDLDGSLKHTRDMGKDFDPGCRSLIPVACRVVGAHILACLSDEPPADIDYLVENMSPRFAPYDFDNTKIAYETEIIEEGNWKLVIENNRECYHCAAGHPELNVSFLPEDFAGSTEGMTEESLRALEAHKAKSVIAKESWESEGLVCDAIEYLDEDAVTQFRAQRLVISGHGESQTLDTRVACTKLFGELNRPDLGDTHFWTHNSWTHVMSDHAVISWLIPLSPGKTLVRSKWLVHKDAVEGKDYDLQRLTEVWIATNQQDASLVKITYSGTQDPAYVPGPFSHLVEAYVHQFTRWYTARLIAHSA